MMGITKAKFQVGHFSNNTNIRYHVFSIYSVIVTVLMDIYMDSLVLSYLYSIEILILLLFCRRDSTNSRVQMLGKLGFKCRHPDFKIPASKHLYTILTFGFGTLSQCYRVAIKCFPSTDSVELDPAQ